MIILVYKAYCVLLHRYKTIENDRDIKYSSVEDDTDSAGCNEHEFLCLDGSCIPLRWLCDGSSECDDSEDELNCDSEG